MKGHEDLKFLTSSWLKKNIHEGMKGHEENLPKLSLTPSWFKK